MVEQLLAWFVITVSEDINEQHALVVVYSAQASVYGDDDINIPQEEVDLHVWRDLKTLKTPLDWNGSRSRQEVDGAASRARTPCENVG